MKMTGENSAERACGQILFGLKMSNLNYMVKETPFSAYITVRKKFLKSAKPECETPVKVGESDDTKKLENDLKHAEKKIKGLLTDIAHQNYNLDEFEIKMNAMEKVNAELELKRERSDEKYESLSQEFKTSLENNAEVKKESSKMLNENKKLKDKVKDLDKQIKDEKDSVLLLESAVNNKVFENKRLKEELENLTKIQFPCTF